MEAEDHRQAEGAPADVRGRHVRGGQPEEPVSREPQQEEEHQTQAHHGGPEGLRRAVRVGGLARRHRPGLSLRAVSCGPAEAQVQLSRLLHRGVDCPRAPPHQQSRGEPGPLRPAAGAAQDELPEPRSLVLLRGPAKLGRGVERGRSPE